MSRIFLSAQEHMQNHTYQIAAPASYNPNISTENLVEFQSYLHHYFDPNTRTQRRLSVRYLVDMVDKSVPFIIENDKDVVEIFHLLDAYLWEVHDLVRMRDPDVLRYAKKVLALRDKMFPVFYRVVFNNPLIKQAYYGESQQIHDIFRQANRLNQHQTADPLDHLRNHPYPLEQEPQPTFPDTPAVPIDTSTHSPASFYG